jgi:hypothetical protein
MPDQRRFDRTTEKTRSGGLPSPAGYSRQLSVGDGGRCDGCGETVQPSDILCSVTVLSGLSWRFHEVCYDAWVAFKRQ